MKKTRKIIAVALTLILALSLVSCKPASTGGGDTAGTTPDKTWSVSMSCPQSGGILAETATEWCNSLSDVTGGVVTATYFGNSALGNQRDMVNAMAAGEIEMVFDGSVPVDLFAPEYGFLVAPYLVRSVDHLKNLVESDIWKGYEEALAANGILILGTAYRGPRQTTSSSPINWSDPSSTIIRMPDVATYVAAWNAIGANTQVMGGGELYSALQNKVVTACEGPYEQFQSMAINEVCSYLYETSHCNEFYCVYASKTWFESLPAETQKQIKDSAVAYCADVSAVLQGNANDIRDALVATGMTLEIVDTAPLYEKVSPVWEAKFDSGEWTSSLDEVLSYNK